MNVFPLLTLIVVNIKIDAVKNDRNVGRAHGYSCRCLGLSFRKKLS
jgi:hypothetical protein